MAWKKNWYRTKKSKYTKKGIPKAVIPQKVTDKHIAQVAKRAIRIRAEEKYKPLFYQVKVPMSGTANGWITDLDPTNTNQNLFRLNTIQGQGTANQPSHQLREGIDIEAVKVDISMRSYYSQTPSLTSSTQTSDNKRFRVIVFWYDQQDNDTLVAVDYPQKTEMFLNNSDTNPTLPYSQVDYIYNPMYRNRFGVLMDKTYMVGNQGNLVHTLKRTIYLKNKRCRYNKDASTAADSVHKGLFLLLLTDNPVSSGIDTNQITKHELNCCFHFRDI